MKVNQPIRGQESLCKLYKMYYYYYGRGKCIKKEGMRLTIVQRKGEGNRKGEIKESLLEDSGVENNRNLKLKWPTGKVKE